MAAGDPASSSRARIAGLRFVSPLGHDLESVRSELLTGSSLSRGGFSQETLKGTLPGPASQPLAAPSVEEPTFAVQCATGFCGFKAACVFERLD